MSEASQVEAYIAERWEDTVVRGETPEGAAPLPEPYTAPTIGAAFRAFFYWDNYFTGAGLLRRGRTDLALANANNFIHLCQTLGYIPNFNVEGHLNRSQLPVAALLYREIFAFSGDADWLAQACDALEIEYSFWMAMRVGPDGLNAHDTHATPRELDDFHGVVQERIHAIPSERVGRRRLMRALIAEAENWDFTPRYGHRCPDYYAVDLNALLYACETIAGDFSETLGRDRSVWDARAASRRELCDRFLWDAETGLYFDFDYVRGRAGEAVSAANYAALASGLPTEAQARAMRPALRERLEMDHGVAACAESVPDRGQTYQWDYPNAWPPLQFFAILGSRRYGFDEDAERIAAKYVATVERNFAATGQLWEKYNAVTGGIDVGDEYAMPPMMGWTAGTYIYARDVLEGEAERAPAQGA